MLISRVPDSVEGGGDDGDGDDAHEYRTASELFDLMAKNHSFGSTEDEPLTTGELVLLYQNMELGTQLMANANELNGRGSNQRVESVVYGGDNQSDESELSDIDSREDVRHVVQVNEERIDLLTSVHSTENSLCHKLADIELQSTMPNSSYNRQFLFRDPYIKEQLQTCRRERRLEGATLPASLLDYICCKRLEDNYNFYMDNIIRYVNHTIDQLKRISNGDYLTDRAKEKWLETNEKSKKAIVDNSKMLTMSTSIALPVQKITKGCCVWNDLVHSEVDIRSLTKILEKKIVLEVPLKLCNPYELMKKTGVDNMIISCQKTDDRRSTKKKESRVDVVLQLKHSANNTISKLSSIMILQTLPTEVSESRALEAPLSDDVEPLTQTEDSKGTVVEKPKISEIENEDNETVPPNKLEELSDTISPQLEFSTSESDHDISSESNIATKEFQKKRSQVVVEKTPYTLVTPDELTIAMQRLNTQIILPEESTDESAAMMKKKSGGKVRIKSPYENKSFLIEEKKRKKLLEIRERREKRKLALAESCKIIKSRPVKGGLSPQATNSVTKLSITNKSFYNSIYGQATNVNRTKSRTRRGSGADSSSECDPLEKELSLSSDKTNKKYTDKNYYLDDAITEMMFMKMKSDTNGSKDNMSGSTSLVSNDFTTNVFSEPAALSDTSLTSNIPTSEDFKDANRYSSKMMNDLTKTEQLGRIDESANSQVSVHIVPVNTPKATSQTGLVHPLECKKSIEKIYDLMKKIGQLDNVDISQSKSKTNICAEKKSSGSDKKSSGFGENSSMCSDGTSAKHRGVSSTPSSFSLDKVRPERPYSGSSPVSKSSPITVIPKVIISTKSQTPKSEDKKKDRRRIMFSAPTKIIPENPLRAISQLLQEFDNVQKTRKRAEQKSPTPKLKQVSPTKKVGTETSENRAIPRQSSLKKSSHSDYPGNNEQRTFERHPRVPMRDRRPRHISFTEPVKLRPPHPNEDTQAELNDKKVIDIMDAAKEAKGEAVRGSKLTRLNTLAQPKRSYVQAHSEDYQNRYGRNLMADRLQRLAMMAAEKNSRAQRKRVESTVSVKPHTVAPLEPTKLVSSASSSPQRKKIPSFVDAVSKQSRAVEAPDTNKKMVAVESYVNYHFGHEPTNFTEVGRGRHTARVPLVPSDIDISSVTTSSFHTSAPTTDLSTTLGSKLHNMIDNMLLNSSPKKSPTPGAKLNVGSGDNFSAVETKCINEDKKTSAALKRATKENKEVDSSLDANLKLPASILISKKTGPLSSDVAEATVQHQMSVGTFHKRLMIQNLSLSPKRSLSQVVLLHSGDASSLLLDSAMSRNLQLTEDSGCSVAGLAEFSDSSIHAMLPQPHNWGFSPFPMQIATVGYVFPKYGSTTGSPVAITDTSNSDSNNLKPSSRLNKSDLINDRLQLHSKHRCITKQIVVHMDSNCQAEEYDGSFLPLTDKYTTCLEQSTQAHVSDFENITKAISNTMMPPELITYPTRTCKMSDKEIFTELTPNANKPKHTPFSAIQRPNVQTETFENIALKNVCHVNKTKDKKEKVLVTEHIQTNVADGIANTSSKMECTTSLDMLVGLLNEIQKITSPAQTENSETYVNSTQYKELKIILNNAAAMENTQESHELLIETAVDALRQTKSNQSVYSFYKKKEDTLVDKNIGEVREYVDKEVGVDNSENNLMCKSTTVSSLLLPILMHNSTLVGESLVDALSRRQSNQSIMSLASDFQTLFSISPNIHNLVEDNCPIAVPTESVKHEGTQVLVAEVKKVTKKERPSDERGRKNVKLQIQSNEIVRSSNFDPTLKMKRDILVTVYSILVFTVFAALSFPELLNQY